MRMDALQTGGKRAGCCTAALFLRSFVEGVEPAEGAEAPSIRWAHIDIAGSMEVRLVCGGVGHKWD